MNLQKLIDALNEIQENAGMDDVFVGLRGTSEWEQSNHKPGDFLACSIDDADGRGIEYDPELPTLPGSSCFYIDLNIVWYKDCAARLTALYNMALNYSDCGKVILVVGDIRVDGADNDEVVIGNSYADDRATYYMDVE